MSSLGRPTVVGLCEFCDFPHLPDYSDVRDTPRSWIEGLCMYAKGERRLAAARPSPGVADVQRLHEEIHRMERPQLVTHVKFVRLNGYADAPSQAYRHDAGFDLSVCERTNLPMNQWVNVHTGVVAAIPEGYWGHILARSSTWRHLGIRVEPAVIDASYRGELMVYANSEHSEQFLEVGQRIAQIVIVPLPNVEWLEQVDLPPGERGSRGYGSSGA